MKRPLWTPSAERIAATNLTAFLRRLQEERALSLQGYADLYRWSCDDLEGFWQSVWQFGGVVAETQGDVVLQDPDRMPGARFFPRARLNFAENLLRRQDDGDAIVFRAEDRIERRLSHRQLHDSVSRLAQALSAIGIDQGDRVAAYMPNMPETVIAMLAAASLGAVFSSCSPDFGVDGVVDRFGQIEPKALISCDAYLYKGKEHSLLARLKEISALLPGLEHVVVVGNLATEPDLSSLQGIRGLSGKRLQVTSLDDLLRDRVGGAIDYRQLPFNHPLYILYSSGTTGKPKCIVHGAGGTLLKHLCELGLLCDVRRDDRVFYFTTCGWMMWNWLVSALACEATLLLYDGNPFWPSPEALFDYAEAEATTLFGTSAKYIDALSKVGLEPRTTHDLGSLRTMTSTGSPLSPAGYDYVYAHIKSDICLSSIAGGTDIVGCFMCGNPIGPVWRGELQARALGMAVDIFDGEGRSLRSEKGELVCTKPFPSMPIHFWNDGEGDRYRAAYFERYPGVWWHGDFAEITEHDGVIMHGRSDSTLNPGGVRIGTAEIYRRVEALDEIEEALVVGQDWQNDVRIVLFLRLRPGLTLNASLESKIAGEIRRRCSPRHVPAKILQVADIPRTKSGKIVELAVREVIHGRQVLNKQALANPEALDDFRDRRELDY